MRQVLEERIRQSLFSRSRRFHIGFWGKAAIILTVCCLSLLVIFSSLVVYHYRQAKADASLFETLQVASQAERIVMLHGDDDPSIGPATAKATVVIFEDFQCPFTNQAQPFIRKLLAKYAGNVRVVFKDFPLTVLYEHSQTAAEAAQCAAEQGKFWEFHDQLFANRDRVAPAFYRVIAKDVGLNMSQFNECYATGKFRQSIARDIALGRQLGVRGTPTFFVNGELFAEGYNPSVDSAFEQALEYVMDL